MLSKSKSDPLKRKQQPMAFFRIFKTQASTKIDDDDVITLLICTNP